MILKILPCNVLLELDMLFGCCPLVFGGQILLTMALKRLNAPLFEEGVKLQFWNTFKLLFH